MSGLIQHLAHFIHKHFLGLLVSAYVLAVLVPQPGIWLRQVQLGQLAFFGGNPIKISLSLIMLSFLLFNAGFGIKAQELLNIRKSPFVILSGFIANMAVPILLIFGLKELMLLWHNSDEIQSLLVGLAMIVSMPIAGSSTAWSQNANGNLGLSLGLVFLSTVLSPWTTPLVLNIFGFMTKGDYAEDLHELGSQGTDTFLMLTVVMPALLGIVVHFLLGEKRTGKFKHLLKLANFFILLLLNYSNATTSLPQAFAKPDFDYLAFIIAITTVLCGTAFGAGWLIGRVLKTERSDQASLMFGLGMNNNGTGLVLASATLGDHPAVLLPMIFYTLVQQIIAALVDWKLFKSDDD